MTKLPRGTFFLLVTHFVWGAPTKPSDGAHGVLHKSQLKLPAVFELETELAQPTGGAGRTNFCRGWSAWGVRLARAGPRGHWGQLR